MNYSPLIEQLVNAFKSMPGVGQKSAQRMVLHFLEKDRTGGLALAKALTEAMEGVGQCQQCRTLSETDICSICSSVSRDSHLLCVVETPADVMAVEQSNSYRGRYFVLMGHLSPIDGVGPDEIGIPQLLNLVKESQVTELILATNPTVEGEATAYYIAEQFKGNDVDRRDGSSEIKISRIAHGVPIGGELEYIDGRTLVHSFAGRQLMSGSEG